jgi:DNA-binding NtrC family response regulator
VLIIDDDRTACDAIAVVVRELGHDACCMFSFDDGLEASQMRDFEVVLVDVQLPDGSGLDLLPRLRQKVPCPEVIIMTGQGDPDGTDEGNHGDARSFPRWDQARATAIMDTERVYLQDLMAYTGGDVWSAREISGLSRARLYALLKKHGIGASRRKKG